MQATEQSPDPVARALAYPYAVPPRSFLLGGASPADVREVDPADTEAGDRTRLLAYGSNAAPEVLARKLGGSAGEHPVLAVRGALSDFDVVYSAHISPYGSIPAALQRSPGTETAVFVLHLTGEQSALISPTEPNYELVALRGISCRLESGEALVEIDAFASRHGPLLVDGTEVALAAVEARGRRFPAMSETEVLEHVRDALCPGEDLGRFMADWRSKPLSGLSD